MIRCKDIAAIVGVSRQAVTDVLNNSRPHCVSEKKRAQILQLAAEHGYSPDRAALALKTGRSDLIGVVMPPWRNVYIAELCMSIQKSLTDRNYTPFFVIDNNYNPVPGNLEKLLSLRVAGIITVASSLLPDSMSIPVVSYYYDDPRFDSVCPNTEEDSRLIIEHLKECGHRSIGYLGPLDDPRVPYLVSEAKRCGLRFPGRWRASCERGDCEEAFARLLERNSGLDLPTALIVHNDDLALKLMRCIREKGFRIPEDISVIGHNNVSFCGSTTPALTSVSFGSVDKIADTMVGLLMEQMETPGRPRKKVLLKSVLTKRESVANLKHRACT